MTDHLAEIWRRFEKTTRRELTSHNIDNIPRPVVEEMRRNQRSGTSVLPTGGEPLPDDMTPPAKQAFAALRSRLVGFDEKGRPSKRKLSPTPEAGLEDDPMAQMVIDLKATEQRVARREMDYRSWYAEQEEQRQRKPRKKFLGIF